MQWTDIMTPEGNLEMLKHLLAGHGAVRVVTKGMSEAGVRTLLKEVEGVQLFGPHALTA